MDSRLSSARRPAESILTGGRPIRKVGSRSSSRSRGPGIQPSVPLLEFLNSILKFSKVLLRQEKNPLRDDLPLDAAGSLGPQEGRGADPMMDQMEHDAADDLETPKWSENCAAIKMELNRLVMWKFDVAQRQLIPALKEQSPLYSVLCESILSIAELLKSRKLSVYLPMGNMRVSADCAKLQALDI